MKNIILIDIMENGLFYGQLKYEGEPITNPTAQHTQILTYVYSKIPSLMRKNITIHIANQRASHK